MKNPTIRPNHSKKEQTTNYAADTHALFCVRCILRNGTKYCPRTKNGYADMKGCSV